MNFLMPVVSVLLLYVISVGCSRTKPNQMVTMTKAELMEIVNCISKSQNQATCNRLDVCNRKMPDQVSKAYVDCNKKKNPDGKWNCNKNEQLYASEEIPSEIFDCINKHTTKLNATESNQMMEFENCARELYIGACPAPKRV